MANERNEQDIDDILAQLRKSMNKSEQKSASSAGKSSFDLEVEEKLRAQVTESDKKKGTSSFSVFQAGDSDENDGDAADEDFSVSELEIVKDGALHSVEEEKPEEKEDDLSDWISRFTTDEEDTDDEPFEPEEVETTEEDEPTVDGADEVDEDEDDLSDTDVMSDTDAVPDADTETEDSDGTDAVDDTDETVEKEDNVEADMSEKGGEAGEDEENDEIDDDEPDWEALMALMTPKQLAQFKQVMAEREAAATAEEKGTAEEAEEPIIEDEAEAAEEIAEEAVTTEEAEPETVEESEAVHVSAPEISHEADQSDAHESEAEPAEKSDETTEAAGDKALPTEEVSPAKGFALMDDAEEMPLIKVGPNERSTFSLMEEEPVEPTDTPNEETEETKAAEPAIPEETDDTQEADDAREYDRMLAALMAHMTPEQLKRFYRTAEEEGIVLPASAYNYNESNESLKNEADAEDSSLTGAFSPEELEDADETTLKADADTDEKAENDDEAVVLLHADELSGTDELSDADEDESAENAHEHVGILHAADETDEESVDASQEPKAEATTAPGDALWQLLQDPERLEAFRARLTPEQQEQLQQMIDARGAEREEEDDTPMLEPVSNGESEVSQERTEAAYAEGDDVPEPADIAPDMTDDDIMLMLGLGYEKELVERLGRDRIERVKKLTRHGEAPERAHAPAYGYNGREFRHKEQIPEIQGRYKKAKRVMFVRLVGTSLFTVLLFLYEVCGLFRGMFGGIFDVAHYPVIAIMAGWQLLLLAAAFSLRPLLRGIRSVFKLEPDDHAMTSLVVALVMLNDMLMPLFFKGSNLYLYNFPAAVCLVLSVLCDMAKLWREAAAFEVVASSAPKYVGEAVRVGGMAEADRDEKDGGEADRKEHAKNAILARRAGFVSGYFRRTTQKPRGRQILNFVFIPLVAVALVMSVITGIQGNDVATVLRAFLVTVLIGMPVSYEVLRAYAFYKVNRELAEKDCTIVGESSVEEYDRYRNVIFDDKELFPHSLIKTKGFKFNENNMIYAVILKISILFRGIGGPVNEVLDLDSEELKRFIATGEGAELAGGKITLDKVTEEGVEASLSDGSGVLAGSAVFLTQHGVAVRQTTKDLQLLQSGDMSILYLAFDGMLCARFYVDYQPDTEFENVANMLDDVGYHVYVRTLDPGIHEEMIHHKCFEDTAAISVVRASVANLSAAGGSETARVNSGIVAGGNQKKVALPLRAVRRLSRLFRFGTRFYGVLVGINMLVATVLTACNMIGRMATWAVALYMVVWAATALVITRYYDR